MMLKYVVATALAAALVQVCSAAHGDVLASSSFHWGTDEWSLFGPGQLEVYDRSGMLFGSDKGSTVWYFSAPQSFLGDKCFAHNGQLSFRIGHSEYMSNGKDMIKDWDVILESKVWRLRFGMRDVVPPWVGASSHEIVLNEKSGWVNLRSGHAPTTIEMLRMVTSLSGLYIRGGYYDGHEETWLDSVVLKEGDHKADALLRRVEKHARHPSERPETPQEEKPAPEPSLESTLAERRRGRIARSRSALAAQAAREAAQAAAKQAEDDRLRKLQEEVKAAAAKAEDAASKGKKSGSSKVDADKKKGGKGEAKVDAKAKQVEEEAKAAKKAAEEAKAKKADQEAKEQEKKEQLRQKKIAEERAAAAKAEAERQAKAAAERKEAERKEAAAAAEAQRRAHEQAQEEKKKQEAARAEQVKKSQAKPPQNGRHKKNTSSPAEANQQDVGVGGEGIKGGRTAATVV